MIRREDLLIVNGVEVNLLIKSPANTKHIRLRYRSDKNLIVVTLPQRAPLSEAEKFLELNQAWVNTQVGLGEDRKSCFVSSGQVMLRGVPHTLIHDPKVKGVFVESDKQQLTVGGTRAQINQKLYQWIRLQAQVYLTEITQDYADQLSVHVDKVSIRNMRTRWGSCSSRGNISYNWRIMMTPDSVIHYLCAHEVAHRLQMNHSDQFWKQVERLDPEHKIARKWLRSHEQDLFAVKID